MSERFVLGDSLTVPALFYVNNVLTDPTAVTLTVTAPDGTSTQYLWPSPADITHVGVGSFAYVVTLNQEGVWSFVYTGTGTAAGVQPSTVTVYPVDPIATSYCTLDELKEWLQISSGDVRDDAPMQRIIASTSRWIDSYCQEQTGTFALSALSARYFESVDYYCLKIDPIGDNTAMTVATDYDGDGVYETSWQTTDWQLLPVNAPLYVPDPIPWRELRAVGFQTFPLPYWGIRHIGRVKITAQWGYPAIPPDIRQACVMQSARVFKRRESPHGLLGNSDFGVVRITGRLDPDVEQLLEPFKDNSGHPVNLA